jgi:hypothetical protein
MCALHRLLPIALDVTGEVGLKVVVARRGVRLTVFLAKVHLSPTVLHVNVLHLHPERGTDAREAEHHQCDQRPVAQADDSSHLDAVDQCARLLRR